MGGCLRVSEGSDPSGTTTEVQDSITMFGSALAPLKPKPENAALLLGLAFTNPEQPEAPTRYRTYYIRFDDNGAYINTVLPYLVVPGTNKLFFVGNVLADSIHPCNLKLGRSTELSKSIEALWLSRGRADSSGARAKVFNELKAEILKLECDQKYHEREFVVYAGRNVLFKSYYSSKRSLTGRAATENFRYELQELAPRETDFSAKKLLGTARLKRVSEELEAAFASDTVLPLRLVDESSAKRVASLDSISVGLVRSNGQVYYTAQSGRFPYYNVTEHWTSGVAQRQILTIPADKDLVPFNQPVVSLADFKRIRSSVCDVIVSPNQGYVVVVTRQQLLILNASTRKVVAVRNFDFDWEPSAATHLAPPKSGNGVCMAEWATSEEDLKLWQRAVK
jgi:hypothetical protein